MPPSLTRLDFSTLKLTLKETKEIFKAMVISKQVSELILRSTQLRPNTFAPLQSLLAVDFTLTLLDLSDNDLDDKCLTGIADALTRNRLLQLRTINLAHNPRVTDLGVYQIVDALKVNKTVDALDVTNNPEVSIYALEVVEIITGKRMERRKRREEEREREREKMREKEREWKR